MTAKGENAVSHRILLYITRSIRSYWAAPLVQGILSRKCISSKNQGKQEEIRNILRPWCLYSPSVYYYLSIKIASEQLLPNGTGCEYILGLEDRLRLASVDHEAEPIPGPWLGQALGTDPGPRCCDRLNTKPHNWSP